MDAAVPARTSDRSAGFPVSDFPGAQTNGTAADDEIVWS
jgi:hypothetical protein